MGVMDLEPAELDEAVETLITQREQARDNKEWDTADMLRKRLKEKGIEVIDTKEGPVWKKVKG
jgi:cysteinyl-tRNA synthetase